MSFGISRSHATQAGDFILQLFNAFANLQHPLQNRLQAMSSHAQFFTKAAHFSSTNGDDFAKSRFLF